MTKAKAGTTTYRVTFDRIGRDHHPKPLVCTVPTDDAADALALEVYRYVKPMLASKWFEVTVNLPKRKGGIELGRFGEFTFEEVAS